MARPKKSVANTDETMKQFLDEIKEIYLNPPEHIADENGRMPLNLLAEEFSMTPIKIRKLLITAGAYHTPTSDLVHSLFKSGKNVKEIKAITGLSEASISGYLPYRKVIYNLEESTNLALRLRKYRHRKAMTEKLVSAMENADAVLPYDLLWEVIVAFAEYSFTTSKGLRFNYTIKGNELHISRKEKSVTKSSVYIAFKMAMELQREGHKITGPKMLGCFGASYLYPIFIRIGVIRDGEEETDLQR